LRAVQELSQLCALTSITRLRRRKIETGALDFWQRVTSCVLSHQQSWFIVPM
jgi:hypothetical protein